MRIPRILMLVGGAYLIALVASPLISATALLATAGATAVAVGLAWRMSSERDVVALAAWAPIHLLLLATGSVASPFLPLAAGWIILLVVVAPGLAAAAAAGIALLVPSVHRLIEGVWPTESVLVSFVLVLGIALSALLVRERAPPRRSSRPSGEDEHRTSPSPSSLEAAPTGDPFAEALELIRLAAGATQVALWQGDAESHAADLRAWAGEDESPPEPRVALPGHPFEWSMLERVNIQLEAGRKPLPSAWAGEMLLVPVDLPEGLLTLAFRERASPAAGEVARRGAPHLTALERLSAVEREAERGRVRMVAVMEMVRALSADLNLEALGMLLARTVLEGIGASGVAVTATQNERGRSRVVGGAGSAQELIDRVGEEDSRVALTVRRGDFLSYDDLRAEHPARPLVHEGEQIEPKPRSAMVAPLGDGGDVHGTIVLWHVEPHWYRPEDADFILLLCSLVAPSLAAANRREEREDEVTAATL